MDLGFWMKSALFFFTCSPFGLVGETAWLRAHGRWVSVQILSFRDYYYEFKVGDVSCFMHIPLAPIQISKDPPSGDHPVVPIQAELINIIQIDSEVRNRPPILQSVQALTHSSHSV